MRTSATRDLVLGLSLAVVAAALLRAEPGHPAAGSSEEPTRSPDLARGAVVVELFTSQDCAMCPPADQLLAKLASDAEWRGRLVPLAFHVDYFNRFGWSDPFSSPQWSTRQIDYTVALRQKGMYTPEIVVNGAQACVGSDEPALRRLMIDAAAMPAGRVDLRLSREGSRLQVDVDATPPAGSRRRLSLMLAIFENGLETGVQRGENARRTLREDFVVRSLGKVFGLRGDRRSGAASIQLRDDWKIDQLGVAAFLQDASTRAIVGADSKLVPR